MGTVVGGLPAELADARPSGFLGRHFAAVHADLRLPPRLSDWSDHHILLAMSRRGEDYRAIWLSAKNHSLDGRGLSPFPEAATITRLLQRQPSQVIRRAPRQAGSGLNSECWLTTTICLSSLLDGEEWAMPSLGAGAIC